MDDRFYKQALKSGRVTMDHALLAYRFVELVAREKRQILGYAKMLRLVTYIVQNFCVGSRIDEARARSFLDAAL